jgi:hypothetical protein
MGMNVRFLVKLRNKALHFGIQILLVSITERTTKTSSNVHESNDFSEFEEIINS